MFAADPERAARLFLVQEEERHKFARQLHDGAAQALALLSLYLETPAADEQAWRAQLRSFCQDAIGSVRQTVADLQKPSVTGREPEGVLQRLLVREARAKGLALQFRARDLSRVPHLSTLLTYRFLQACLTEASGDSAKNNLKVLAAGSDKQLRVMVLSDAIPRVEEQLASAGWRDRVELLGGSLRFRHLRDGYCGILLRLPHYDVLLSSE